ncbi:MAG: hypothetical protein EOP61_23470 [Sphingomonadales bacterium]|nr:MAG: hypothetical protein EOP61_23470 [Sphingomonadales bacterium]
MMRNSVNRQILVVSSPKGPLRETHMAMRTGLMPELRPGQVLVRVRMLSIDPILRFLFDHDSPLNSRLKPGDVMGGWGMCEVVDPNGTALPKGTIAWLWCGWQDYFAVDAVAVQPVVDDAMIACKAGGAEQAQMI